MLKIRSKEEKKKQVTLKPSIGYKWWKCFFIIIQQRLDLNLRSLGQQAKKYAMSKRLTTINQSMFICREHNVDAKYIANFKYVIIVMLQ